jgi:hypothetical protein
VKSNQDKLSTSRKWLDIVTIPMSSLLGILIACIALYYGYDKVYYGYASIAISGILVILALVSTRLKHAIKDLNEQERWRIEIQKQDRRDDESR